MTKNNSTTFKKSANRDWRFYDATNSVLGMLAVKIAKDLIGKNSASFSSHQNTGDIVVVTNAEKIVLTGSKKDKKVYYHHTGYPKGLREVKYGQLVEKDPRLVLIKAVKGMLPKNRLQRERMNNLHVYIGSEHPHKAQESKTN